MDGEFKLLGKYTTSAKAMIRMGSTAKASYGPLTNADLQDNQIKINHLLLLVLLGLLGIVDLADEGVRPQRSKPPWGRSLHARTGNAGACAQ